MEEDVKHYYYKLYATRDATGSQVVNVVSRRTDQKLHGLRDAIFEYQESFGPGWQVIGEVVSCQYALQWLKSRSIQNDRFIGSERT